MAVWRRKLNIPDVIRDANQDEILAMKAGLKRRTRFRTLAPGTIRSARSLSLSSSSDIADPISAQPQQRFSGMTLPVAEFLANNVFCLLDDHKDDSKRISARAFGNWIKDLPNLLGGPSIRRHTRNISTASVQESPFFHS
ncbi:hypothetical protein BD311DRAFT_811634 [Dichomitus squalens]|uniref:Uncharacterized protein n=1 Tax=Dichomitus squalens TaxID=114155 RepID=A0A4Q9M5T9_9APHY|nr:hypothetical protein BD311DRAFT_812501 [Dichomitus squalens]TBU22285.1 hypothetical protein BD311DRAFT_811634 [Dichomitus squalens]